MSDNILDNGSGVVMSDNHDGNETSNIIPMPNVPPHNPKKGSGILSFLKKQKDTLIVAILGALAASAIWGAISNIYSLPYRIDRLSDQVNQLAEVVEDQESSISELKELIQAERLDRVNAIRDSEKDMQEYINGILFLMSSTDLRPTEVMIQALKSCADKDTPSNNSSGVLTATTLVAYNIITNEKFTAGQIADQRVLLPYMDGEKEVYFYGALSETGAWDGDCIINIYENRKLTFIKEAKYDNGKILKSRQVFSYPFNDTQDVWAISDRSNNGDHSEGETRIYKWERDYNQRFEMDEVTPNDIIDIGTFKKGISPNLYAYYYGSTSNGYFNDESGTSYMVHFFDDGTVRLLYVGNFRNGNFNDTTGNAWYIVKNENTDYMYYKGHFKDGNVSKLLSFSPPPLSLEQIKEIIGDRNFNVELCWDGLGIT